MGVEVGAARVLSHSDYDAENVFFFLAPWPFQLLFQKMNLFLRRGVVQKPDPADLGQPTIK